MTARRDRPATMPARATLAAVLVLLVVVGVSACSARTLRATEKALHQATTSAQPGATSSGTVRCRVVNGRADRTCTPGADNPDVTQATIRSTICAAGWTDTVRPPAAETDQLKAQQKAAYGEQYVSDANLAEDALVPLELGGAPRDPRNLWPQPGPSAAVKDTEEARLRDEVCAGRMTLDAARQRILADWTH